MYILLFFFAKILFRHIALRSTFTEHSCRPNVSLSPAGRPAVRTPHYVGPNITVMGDNYLTLARKQI